MFEFLMSLPTLFHSAIVFGTVILFGSLGEILTEKSGNLNLGVPGIMYMGAISGLSMTYIYENIICKNLSINPSIILCILICLFSTLIASAFLGFIYSYLTISLRTNQNVAGLTLTIFGVGFGNFFGGSLNRLAGGVGQVSVKMTSNIFSTYNESLVKLLDNMSGNFKLGTLFFSYGFLTYVAIILAILLNYLIFKTRFGLNLRSVGESAATADACGISVNKMKYFCTITGSCISGLGGIYFVMNYIKGTWESQGNLESLGWLAVALVIFASWKPLRAIWGSYLFGILYWAYFYMPGLNRSSQEIFKMLPYIVTILVLVITSIKKNKDLQPPGNLGIPYFREDR